MASTVRHTKKLYPIGELPPPGVVPEFMHAQVIRRERFGDPEHAFQIETVPVPPLGALDVLVAVIAAGVNYNNVWAALGRPVDVIAARNKQGEPEDFHIGGSDAAGIVYQVGDNVANVRVGDEVIVSPGFWEHDDPYIAHGGDAAYAPSLRAWGYETNWGSFAQFCRARAWQVWPRPRNLSWEDSAAYLLCGATAVRMLLHWEPNVVTPGMPVLIWGGSGGLGCMAVQIVKAAGGIPVAVVNSEEKAEFCKRLGAAGVIRRDHVKIPGARNKNNEAGWIAGANVFREEVLTITKGKLPEIVFEHPGEHTLPLSFHLCAPGGMVVICAGTTGYLASMAGSEFSRKSVRFQGSHFAGQEDIRILQEMITCGQVHAAVQRVFSFNEIGHVHQLMHKNEHPPGNIAIRVGPAA